MATAHDETLKELQQAAIAAGLHHEIWWVFRGKDTRPKYIDVINRFVSYFRASISAHFIAMLVALYRLYETRKDTHNIPILLDRLEADRSLAKADIDLLRARYASAKPIWIKVAILRNEVFGHRAMDTDVDKAFEKADVTPDELKELVDTTKSLLNELTLKLSDSTHAFNLSATRDTTNLLEALKKR